MLLLIPSPSLCCFDFFFLKTTSEIKTSEMGGKAIWDEPERPGRVPEVLLGLLRVPRHHRTKQGRHINAPSPDIGALQVLLGLKCHLSFHLGPCLHLKKKTIIPALDNPRFHFTLVRALSFPSHALGCGVFISGKCF